MQRTSFLDFVHGNRCDLWRVITFGWAATTLKKRPICSEELRSIDWKDKMTASSRSNTPGSGEFLFFTFCERGHKGACSPSFL